MGRFADNTTFQSNIPKAADIAVAIVYSVFGVFSLFGNSMLLYVSYKKKNLLKPAEFFIINLAISDLGMTVTLYPLAITSSISHRWLYGKTICLIYAFCGVLFGICSLSTLTLLSTVCCMKVCYPIYGNRFNYDHGRLLIACAWAFAMVFACSPLAHWGNYGPEPYGTACCIDWKASSMEAVAKSYTVALFIFCFFIPCGIIITSYTQILITVKESRKAVEKHISAATRMGNVQTIIVKLLFLMLYASLMELLVCLSAIFTRFLSTFSWISVAVCIGFVTAWTPYAVVAMWAAFGCMDNIPPIAFAVPAVFAKSSTLYNPLIYLLLKPNFRNVVCKYFGTFQQMCLRNCLCVKTLQNCNYRTAVEVSLKSLKRKIGSSTNSVQSGHGCTYCTCERCNDPFECFKNYPKSCQENINTLQFTPQESTSPEPKQQPKMRQTAKKSVRVIIRGQTCSELDSLEITLETVPVHAIAVMP